MAGQRWAVFVHDVDGDSGDGRIVGPFRDVEKADAVADRIKRAADRRAGDARVPAGYSGDGVECIVLPVMAGDSGGVAIIEAVMP